MNIRILFFTFLSFQFIYAQLDSAKIVHFSFNNDYKDLSNSALNVTNFGTVFSTDRNNNAEHSLDFSGQKYLKFDDNAVKVSLPITISTWVKFESLSNPQIIFMSDNVYENYYGYSLIVLPNTGQLALNIAAGLGGSNSSNRRSLVSDVNLNTGKWYHVVGIIRDYNDMDIYIDCKRSTGVYSGTGSTKMAYSNTYSSIGYNVGNNLNTNGTFLDGYLDDFVIWNRELNTNEISFLCDINSTLSIQELNKKEEPKLLKVIDLLGRETDIKTNSVLIYQYSDGSIKKGFITE